MCGLAGWYRRAGRPVAAAIIEQQCDRIRHRGPDDSGVFAEGDFGFGMRRLSIIDVAGGHQPIDSADGRFAIVFNGEIYNHLELRRELAAAGVVFRTHSDTETLLACFVRWQEQAWIRLQGMFAVAIWDRLSRTLTLARDPLGIKPLYLSAQDGGIAFASEIRALRVLPGHHFDIDEHAVHDFFSFGHVQTPGSIFRQVHALAPGHWLRIGPEGEPQLRAFWRPQFRIVEGRTESDWIEETRERVSRTVRAHMLSDVPVGVFLSGGVDSGAIAAVMSRDAVRPVKAFTLGFPGTRNDETQAARRVAAHIGCEHIVLPLEPVAAGELLPAVQSAFDEPCAATAAVPIWHLSRLAAQHVKVVLCGEGGDELFAGYKRQRSAQRMARMRTLLRLLAPLTFLIDRLPVTNSRVLNYRRQSKQRFRNSALLASAFQRFFAGTQITTPALRERVYEDGFWQREDGPGAFERLEAQYFPGRELQSMAPLQQFLLADLTLHMPSSLLNRLDRASMAHSLEARVPFLAHDFVDWSLSIPLDLKLRGRTGKYVLRKAVEPWLPPEVTTGPKLGFQLPFAEWFRGDFSEFAREAWHDSGAAAAGYLRPGVVDLIFEEHRTGRANHGKFLYALAMFGCWWGSQGLASRQRPAAR